MALPRFIAHHCLFHFSHWVTRYEALTDPEIVLSYKSSLGSSQALHHPRS
jgi:hypothetical protein